MITKPIYILGAARSGTGLLYETLCQHRELAYISDRENYNIWKEQRWKEGTLSLAMALYHPRRWKPKIKDELHPNEGRAFWSRFLPHYKYMTDQDVTPEIDSFLKSNIERILAGKSRFINKDPMHGYRMRLLNRLFPDAKFIHIIRDPRAVAYSELKRNRDVKRALGQRYRPDKSYMYNVGLLWKETVNRGLEGRAFGSRYYEVRYEDLIKSPIETLKAILAFCELEWSHEFESRIPKMEDMNVKWRNYLNDQDIDDLVEAIGPDNFSTYAK